MTDDRAHAYVLGRGGQRGELPGFKATAADTAGAMSLLEFAGLTLPFPLPLVAK